MTLFMGLDLGQAQDYTALSVVEAQPTKKKYWGNGYEPIREIEGLPVSFNVRHLQRYTLGTSYPIIIEDVVSKIKQFEGTVLAIDHTGVGRPVFDLFERAGLHPLGITITGSDMAHGEGRQWRVPKRDLVGVLQVAVQGNRLKVAKELPDATTLVNELLNFRVKINLKTAHDSYEAWREGVHDDLVLSVALACWAATQFYTSWEQSAGLSIIQQKLDNEFEGIMRGVEL
ncbi:MAG: hypothetical protein ABSF21_00650 [Dehalococcoidia bacterium]